MLIAFDLIELDGEDTSPSPSKTSFKTIPACGRRTSLANVRLRCSIGVLRIRSITAKPRSLVDDCFAVEQERSGRQRADGLDCERKPRREIMAVSTDQPDTGTVTPRHDAKAVMLDFVQPARP